MSIKRIVIGMLILAVGWCPWLNASNGERKLKWVTVGTYQMVNHQDIISSDTTLLLNRLNQRSFLNTIGIERIVINRYDDGNFYKIDVYVLDDSQDQDVPKAEQLTEDEILDKIQQKINDLLLEYYKMQIEPVRQKMLRLHVRREQLEKYLQQQSEEILEIQIRLGDPDDLLRRRNALISQKDEVDIELQMLDTRMSSIRNRIASKGETVTEEWVPVKQISVLKDKVKLMEEKILQMETQFHLGSRTSINNDANSAESLIVNKLIPLDYVDIELQHIFEDLRSYGANIVVYWQRLEKAGVFPEQPVTIRAHDVTIGKAIELVLNSFDLPDPFSLTHHIDDQNIVVVDIVDVDIEHDRQQLYYQAKEDLLEARAKLAQALTPGRSGARNDILVQLNEELMDLSVEYDVLRHQSRYLVDKINRLKATLSQANVYTNLEMQIERTRRELDEVIGNQFELERQLDLIPRPQVRLLDKSL